MRVRIVNDGQPGYMTRITDVDTGEDLSEMHIVEIYISADRNKIPHAILRTVSPSFDVIAEADIKHICPHCGHAVALKKSTGGVKVTVEPSVWDL